MASRVTPNGSQCSGRCIERSVSDKFLPGPAILEVTNKCHLGFLPERNLRTLLLM